MPRRSTHRVRTITTAGALVVLFAAVLYFTQAGPTAQPSPRADRDQDVDARDTGEFGTGPVLTLARLARARDIAGLDRVLTELKGRIPLVESDPRVAGRSIVTFLYRGDETVRAVSLPQLRYGPVPYADGGSTRASGPRATQAQFRRLADSPLWYLRLNVPNTALLGYTIGCERVKPGASPGETTTDEFLDPLNPQESGGRGSVSMLRLPEAPTQAWITERRDVPKGSVEEASVTSQILGETRHLAVYVPGGNARAGGKANLLIVFDGDWFRKDLRATTVLDNLLFERRIPPTVAVFVDTESPARERDLVNSPRFADFVAKELYPWVVTRFPVNREPRATTLSGASFGGLAATYIALRHPGIFGNVLSQSGAFWPPAGWSPGMPNWAVLEQDSEIIAAYVRAERKPIRFYMDCGLYEPSMLIANRRLRDVLRAKGYDVVYVEHPGSHNGVYWRNSIGDGLIALFGTRVDTPIR